MKQKNNPLKFYPTYFQVLIIFAALLSFKSFAQSSEKPNIIIILVDDMGWSNIGCYGGVIETPNLDKLAEEGIRFNQFYNTARCCPSRASLLTGLSPHEAGVGHMTFKRTGNSPSVISERLKIPDSYRGWLGKSVPTLPEMLKDAGYSTYMAGKWHVGSSDQETWPKQRGFDHFYGFLEGTSDYFNPNDLHRDNKLIKPEGEKYYTTDAFTNEAVQYLKEHETANDADPFSPFQSNSEVKEHIETIHHHLDHKKKEKEREEVLTVFAGLDVPYSQSSVDKLEKVVRHHKPVRSSLVQPKPESSISKLKSFINRKKEVVAVSYPYVI